VVGRGQIEGVAEAMFGVDKAPGSISLSLSDGTSVDAVIVEHKAGRSRAGIFVPRPIPNVIRAVWPSMS
jgi:hypothetical protein